MEDWLGTTPLAEEAPKDNQKYPYAIKSVYAANDAHYIFLRVDFFREIALQDGNRLTLFLDTDGDPETGTPVNGMGADFYWNLGEKKGARIIGKKEQEATHWELGLVSAPTVTATSFEFSIDRRKTDFPGKSIKFFLAESGDKGYRFPQPPGGLAYEISESELPRSLAPLTLEKDHEKHLRILTWNVYEDGLFDAKRGPSFGRLLRAVKPDVIGFQEVDNHDAWETLKIVQKLLPEEQRPWFAKKFPPDLVFLSHYPILQSFVIEGSEKGQTNGAVLLEFPVAPVGKILMLIANPPCCGADRGRQFEADAMMDFIRGAKEPGGIIELPENTPIFITGDMDFVGDSQQPRTLKTGEIVNSETFGTPFKPDWDGTNFTDLRPRHTHEPLFYTYFDKTGPYLPGRLDYIVYSDTVIKAMKAFVLSTPSMPAEFLNYYGLEANDTTVASDHLPMVGNFVFPIISE